MGMVEDGDNICPRAALYFRQVDTLWKKFGKVKCWDTLLDKSTKQAICVAHEQLKCCRGKPNSIKMLTVLPNPIAGFDGRSRKTWYETGHTRWRLPLIADRDGCP